MAVAEASQVEKLEKRERPKGGPSAGGPIEPREPPEWLAWAPRKLAELKVFFAEVKSELKKVTFPGKAEVRATTVVVIVTTIVFGFYLYGMDLIFSFLLSFILK